MNSLWDLKKTEWRGSCAFTIDVYLPSQAGNQLNIYDADGSKRNYKFSCYAIGLSPLLKMNGLMVDNRLYPHGSAQTELALVSWEIWSQSKETSNGRHWQHACQAYKNVRSCVSDRQTTEMERNKRCFPLVFLQILFTEGFVHFRCIYIQIYIQFCIAFAVSNR